MKKIITTLMLFGAIAINAQVLYLKQDEKHEKYYSILKTKIFCFVLPGTGEDAEFKNVIDKYWKFTKYKIITHSEIDNNMNSENIFFMLMDFRLGNTGPSFDEFDMWSPNEKGLAKGRTWNSMTMADMQIFIKIKLKSKDGYVNLHPGYFKNYLQQMQDYMNTYFEKGKAEIVADPTQIKELKNVTLYIPTYVIDGNKPDELFKKYSYKYAEISSEDLNKKILAGEKIYYMVTCIYGMNCKIISIVNAQTGQVLYNLIDAKPLYPYIVKGDFSEINKEIERAAK